VVAGIEDYNLLMEGYKSLLAECNALHEDLESEPTKARASAAEDIATLEARIKFAEAHTVDVAAAGEKRLSDFENELIKDMAELCALYECNIQSVRGLCSLMPEGEPLVTDYIRWLSAEVTGFLEVFADVNENFVSATVKGTLAMVGGSIELSAPQASTVDTGADILPMERDV
jgi:hypothetical protein